MDLNTLGREAHEIARSKGFYDDGERNLGEVIALIHSELSEALEAVRDGNMRGDHGVEEEFADVLIRVLETAESLGFDMNATVERKMAKNRERPYKHGRKF